MLKELLFPKVRANLKNDAGTSPYLQFNGIAAEFLAYPKVDGDPDDPILIGRP